MNVIAFVSNSTFVFLNMKIDSKKCNKSTTNYFLRIFFINSLPFFAPINIMFPSIFLAPPQHPLLPVYYNYLMAASDDLDFGFKVIWWNPFDSWQTFKKWVLDVPSFTMKSRLEFCIQGDL